YKNYVETEMGVVFNQTNYYLDNRTNPFGVDADGDGFVDDLDDGTSRSLVTFDYNVSTTLEKVFDVERDGFLATVTGLGVENQENELRRVRHNVVPQINYRYVPYTAQDDLPLFD